MASDDRRKRPLINKRRFFAQVMVGFFSCVLGAGFIPTHRLSGTISSPHGEHFFRTSASSSSSSRSSRSTCMHSNDKRSPPPSAIIGTSEGNIGRTAVVCLAATIISSTIPLDAKALTGLLPSSRCSDWNGGQTMLVLAEEGGSTGVPGLVSELKRADGSENLLNTMVKINEAVEADEEGLLENTFERESIVKGLFERRRAGGEAWNLETEAAFGILKRKLDPFNVVLLRPYLKIAPFLGGLYYVGVFFVQQKFRASFPLAYFGAVAVLIAPAVIVLLTS